MFADKNKVIIRNGPVKELIGSKGFSVLGSTINEQHILGSFTKDYDKYILLLPIDKNEKLLLPIQLVNIIEYYGRRFYVFNETGQEFYYTYHVEWFDDYSSINWVNYSQLSERSKEIREEVEEVLGEKVEDVECKECPDKNGNDERTEEEKEEPQSIYQVIEYMIDEKISKDLDKKIDFLIGESLKRSAGLKTRMRMGDE